MIQVFEKSTSKLIDIAEADFDPQLQQRIAIGDAPSGDDGGQDLDEFRKEIREDIKLAAKEAAAAAIEAGGGTGVDRSRLGAGAQDAGAGADQGVERGMEGYDEHTRAFAMAGARTRPTAEAQYDRMPQAWKGIRSYMGDLMIVRHINALHNKDNRVLEDIERADQAGTHGHVERAIGVTGTGAAGAFLAPSPLSSFIVLLRDAKEKIAPRSMTFTSESNTLDITTELTSGAVAKVAEGGLMTHTDSTWAQLALAKKKAGRLVTIPYELLQDQLAAFSIVSMLGNQAASKLATYWDDEFASRPDTNIDTTHDIEGNAAAASPAISGELLPATFVDLVLSIASEYRDGGGLVLMGNSQITAWVNQITELSNGGVGSRPFFMSQNALPLPISDVGGPAAVSGVTGNFVGMIMGMPYLEVAFIVDIVVIARLEDAYAVLMDGNLRVDIDTSVGFATDTTALRVLERRDGGILQANAMRKTGTMTIPVV